MQLFRSAFVVSFFTLLSRLTGFARDIFIAHFLGAGILSDVFFAAFRIPNLFRRIFAEGAFNSAFIPLFTEVLETEKKPQAVKFARNIFTLLLYSIIIVTIFMELLTPWVMRIIAPGFVKNEEQFALLINITRIVFPYLLLISLASLGGGILNSLGKFTAGASMPILLNLSFIFSLLFFRGLTPNAAYTLSVGVIIGGILQFIWIFLFLYQKTQIVLYPVLIPRLTRQVKDFFARFIPGVVGASVMQINTMIDTIFATTIPSAVSYLYYADRVNQFPMALIGTAIGIALLPKLSREIKRGNKKKIIVTQNQALELALFFVVPASVALVIIAEPIVAVLFSRGAFGKVETIAVSKALSIYAMGLPAAVLARIFTPPFFARGDTRTPMQIAILCLFTNTALNLVLVHRIGYIGIAIATVVSAWLQILLLLITLLKRRHFTLQQKAKINIFKIAAASVLMGSLLAISNALINIFFLADSYGKIAAFLALSSLIFMGMVCYFYLINIFGIYIWDKLMSKRG